jgi:hypothetical protein
VRSTCPLLVHGQTYRDETYRDETYRDETYQRLNVSAQNVSPKKRIADTFCLTIRFVDDTFCRRYVLSPVCFVADIFCRGYVLAKMFCPDTFCPCTYLFSNMVQHRTVSCLPSVPGQDQCRTILTSTCRYDPVQNCFFFQSNPSEQGIAVTICLLCITVCLLSTPTRLSHNYCLLSTPRLGVAIIICLLSALARCSCN